MTEKDCQPKITYLAKKIIIKLNCISIKNSWNTFPDEQKPKLKKEFASSRPSLQEIIKFLWLKWKATNKNFNPQEEMKSTGNSKHICK